MLFLYLFQGKTPFPHRPMPPPVIPLSGGGISAFRPYFLPACSSRYRYPSASPHFLPWRKSSGLHDVSTRNLHISLFPINTWQRFQFSYLFSPDPAQYSACCLIPLFKQISPLEFNVHVPVSEPFQLKLIRFGF